MKYKNNKLNYIYQFEIIKILMLLIYINNYTNIYNDIIYINKFFL